MKDIRTAGSAAWRHGPGALLLAGAVVLAGHPVRAHAEEVNMTVPMHYRASNPCTNNPLLIAGNIYVVGRFREGQDGYHFNGDVNYGYLNASDPRSGASFDPVRGKEDHLNMTVDIPVDRTISQRVRFAGPEAAFTADITSRVTAGLFGRDVNITGVDLACVGRR